MLTATMALLQGQTMERELLV
ncbi:hypothetical protein Goarm_001281 [Gossypium armourianum]|uniref:Uncharacterized protein n=2 Tax=Gossypium TaxID=3633 RepID=A0A7J9KD25_9ROSI|nr:hypothetical protein [Gossypium klotzschianum]MBA0844159.1 hypothetical protein [Gossypium armourianum]